MNIFSQGDINAVIQSVTSNNTELKAQQQSQVAQTEGFNIGRELSNPDVGFDYFIGSPSTAGNQTDIAITQPFDFPTTYKRKKDLAESQTLGLTHQSEALKKKILPEVKLNCLPIFYQE
jgi:hypothetical protein